MTLLVQMQGAHCPVSKQVLREISCSTGTIVVERRYVFARTSRRHDNAVNHAISLERMNRGLVVVALAFYLHTRSSSLSCIDYAERWWCDPALRDHCSSVITSIAEDPPPEAVATSR